MTVIIPSGLKTNMESSVRNPTAELYVSWNDTLISGEWFRLDQSLLDNNALLTSRAYLENETIVELITDVDAKIYADESEYVEMLEGYSELIGDSQHYASSDLDFELINTNNRFTPRANKNILKNPGFEDNKSYWNEQMGVDAVGIINEVDVYSGIRSYQINNPSYSEAYTFSNVMEIDNDTDTDYVFSQYLTGSGIVTIELSSYELSASGANDITTGLLDTAVYQDTLVSGEWNRLETTLNVASGASYLRAMFSASGSWLRADNGQVEKGTTATIYDDDFIGDLILPKKSVKVNIGFKDNNARKFAGSIQSIVPKIKDDKISVYCYDWVNVLKDKKITSTYYENLRTDQIIENLAQLAGIDSSSMNLEEGQLTIEFAWLQEGSIWTYINQVAEAEGGIVFFDEEGTLNFYNRNHFDTYPDPVYGFTFDDNIMDLDFEVSKQNVKNRIEIKAYPKKKLTSKTIYDLTDSIAIDAGQTEEIWGQFNYGVETVVPAINVQVPVVGTDILANTESDGSGTDVSSDIEISSYSIFQESIKVNIKNNSSSTVYITKFTITGDPIVIKSRIEIVKEDSNSKSLYGTQILSIENNLLDDEDYAETLAEKKLNELKEPLDTIKIDCVGVPYLRVGDIVSAQRSFDGKSENFQIIKNRWQLIDDFVQHLTLQKKVGISTKIYNS